LERFLPSLHECRGTVYYIGLVVVFSFFKKKDQTDSGPKQPAIKLPASQTAQTPDPAPPTADTVFGDTISFDPANIEVSESGDGMDAVVEEVAMLFANEQSAPAIDILQQYLATHPTQASDEPWLMLFELYQQTRARNAFDELAMQFVLKFERTAPVWRIDSDPAASPQPAAATSRGNYFSFVGIIGADSSKLAEFAAAAPKGEKVRLDFSRFESLSADGCLALQQTLARCRKHKTPVQLVAGDKLIGWLQSQIEIMRPTPGEIPMWLLLIEIQQTLGLMEPFENLAVDYAVTYEVSPPSWESPVAWPGSTDAKDETDDALAATAVEAASPADTFLLRGTISDQTNEPLQRLAEFARQHQSIRIDSFQLDRIDFVSAGNLLNLLVELTQLGKSLTIDGVNALVFPLLKIMGINDLATIHRRK